MTSKNFTPSKNPDLMLAALATFYINEVNMREGVVWRKGISYRLQADLFLTQYMREHKIAKAVVSFQCYPNQENVAVARLHRELI
jgi:hypothetical protein